MKSLLFVALLSFSAFAVTAEAPMQTNQGLSMQLESDLVFEKMVMVYDYSGSLIREIPLNDVANNTIDVVDHLILEESDFAFDYQGNYYYFGDSKDIPSIIN